MYKRQNIYLYKKIAVRPGGLGTLHAGPELLASRNLENPRSGASRSRKCSKMLAPKPPDVEKRSKMLAPKPPDVEKHSKMLAPKPLDVEKCSKMLAPKPLGVEKCFHGAERIIEKEIEKEFEKEFRSPALEDASLKEASLNDASLRAFNARVHTSILYIFRGFFCGGSGGAAAPQEKHKIIQYTGFFSLLVMRICHS